MSTLAYPLWWVSGLALTPIVLLAPASNSTQQPVRPHVTDTRLTGADKRRFLVLECIPSFGGLLARALTLTESAATVRQRSVCLAPRVSALPQFGEQPAPLQRTQCRGLADQLRERAWSSVRRRQRRSPRKRDRPQRLQHRAGQARLVPYPAPAGATRLKQLRERVERDTVHGRRKLGAWIGNEVSVRYRCATVLLSRGRSSIFVASMIRRTHGHSVLRKCQPARSKQEYSRSGSISDLPVPGLSAHSIRMKLGPPLQPAAW